MTFITAGGSLAYSVAETFTLARRVAPTSPALGQGAPAHALKADTDDDLIFLAEWESGFIPLFGALFRARQIRRALAAKQRSLV
jgi:hypothetical protein